MTDDDDDDAADFDLLQFPVEEFHTCTCACA